MTFRKNQHENTGAQVWNKPQVKLAFLAASSTSLFLFCFSAPDSAEIELTGARPGKIFHNVHNARVTPSPDPRKACEGTLSPPHPPPPLLPTPGIEEEAKMESRTPRNHPRRPLSHTRKKCNANIQLGRPHPPAECFCILSLPMLKLYIAPSILALLVREREGGYFPYGVTFSYFFQLLFTCACV